MLNHLQAVRLTILHILLCLSGVVCRHQQDGHNTTNLVLDIPHDNPSTHLIDQAVYLTSRKLDAGYPDWESDLTFSFEQFPGDEEVKQVKRTMLGVIDMLQTTMAVMYPGKMEIKQPWPAPKSSKSLERYFLVDDLSQVAEVFKRLLAVLGAPGFKELLDCYHPELLTMKVVYGDHWGSEKPPLCQDEPDTSAYSTWEHDDDHEDRIFAVISLCRPFFENYLDWKTTHPGLFGAERIDSGVVVNTYGLPCYTSSLTFLHELLHWGAMGSSTLGYVIDDQTIFDPRHNTGTKAYRAFYSMKMLDWNNYNKDRWTALSNVDNYVYAVQEIYWGLRTARQREWNDPLPPPGYYPVNRSPPSGGD